MGNELAARLAGLGVLDERGTTIALGRFWEDRAVVLAFVRHFG
jgi:hypothetical protein